MSVIYSEGYRARDERPCRISVTLFGDGDLLLSQDSCTGRTEWRLSASTGAALAKLLSEACASLDVLLRRNK